MSAAKMFGANPRAMGALCVCVEQIAMRSRSRPAFSRMRRATSSEIGAQMPQLSTVINTTGGSFDAEIASAFAHSRCATPDDSP